MVFLSPFLLLPMFRYLFTPRQSAAGEFGLGRTIFVVSTLAIFITALRTNVLFHWNLVAYIALLPFIAPWLRPRWLLWGQIGYGMVFGILAGINFAVMPLLALVDRPDQVSQWSYGWDEVAAHVRAAQQTHHAQFIAATNFTIAGSLGFALHDSKITSLNSVMDQFDFWFVPEDTPARMRSLLPRRIQRPLNQAFRDPSPASRCSKRCRSCGWVSISGMRKSISARVLTANPSTTSRVARCRSAQSPSHR